MPQEPDKLNQLKKRRDFYQQQAFYTMFKILFIFGIPAAIAFFVGSYFDEKYGRQHLFVLISLAISFVLSWVVMFFVYRDLNKKMKQVEEDIQSLERNN